MSQYLWSFSCSEVGAGAYLNLTKKAIAKASKTTVNVQLPTKFEERNPIYKIPKLLNVPCVAVALRN